MNYENKMNTAQTPTEDHLARALQHERSHRDACGRLGRSITAVGDLFGRELREHLTLRHEDVAENAGEAIYHLRRKIEEIEAREGQAIRALVAQAEEHRRVAARATAVLEQALAELERRAKRSGKPAPDFVAAYRRELAAEQEAPF